MAQLIALTDKREIRAAQRLFEKSIKGAPGVRRLIRRVGYHGGSDEMDVFWSAAHRFWAAFYLLDNRYWNAFGTSIEGRGTLGITCEINFPVSGIDRRVSGVLAKDPNGEVAILHRGKIGGGRDGIGKALFWRHYVGHKDQVSEGVRFASEVAIVTALRSPRLMAQLAAFIQEIARVKSERGASPGGKRRTPKAGPLRPFSSGTTSRKRVKVSFSVVPKADHVIVTRALAEQLRRMSLECHKDVRRDIFAISKYGRASALFEVKTDPSTTEVYTGVGQLHIHTSLDSPKPRRVLVVPSNAPFLDEVKSLGIRVVTYSWDLEEPRFTGLGDAIKGL